MMCRSDCDVEVEQEFHFWSEKCTKATEKNCKHAWATFWQWGKQQKIKTSQKNIFDCFKFKCEPLHLE